MKILPVSSIRLLDRQTIDQEPILSIDLMERAASRFTTWLLQKFPEQKSFHVLAGMGNNGGDGLVAARLLAGSAKKVRVSIVHYASHYSDDCAINLKRLEQQNKAGIEHLREGEHLQSISSHDILIDALWGSGLSRPVSGFAAGIIEQMNTSAAQIIAIDIPSGLFADKTTSGPYVQAHHTATFQLPKLSFFFPENNQAVGDWHIIDIGLNRAALEALPTENHLVTFEELVLKYRSRTRFEHKGTRGHGLLIGGSFGKIGAMVLAAKSCLRSGCGLVSVMAPACGNLILQKSIPEVMLLKSAGEEYLEKIEVVNTDIYSIGAGPGMSIQTETAQSFLDFIKTVHKPMVIDADAINILAQHKDRLKDIPSNSILTPHPGEFKRLAGSWSNGFERLSLQKAFSKKHHIILVLKGAYTCTTLPDGRAYFNPNGNPGMATAGSGDTLTGIITALLAQGYPPATAAKLGVFLHGAAGDAAAKKMGMDSLIAGDIITFLAQAFKRFEDA